MARVGAGRRYAEAVFELATRDKAVDAWQHDLALAAGLAADERTVRAIDSPAVSFAHRRQAVERLLGERVSKQALNLALLLTERGRFGTIIRVREDFDDLVRRSRGIVSAVVTSAVPLSKDELAAIRARLEQLSGGGVEVRTVTDAALIGGVSVRIGDRLIDASVRGRLERLRGRLVQGTT